MTILLNYHIGRIVLGSMCVGVLVLLGWSGIRVAGNTDTTPTQPHRNSNTHRTKNNTTNVVIQQNSHKLLMMAILMSETCWAHKNWNKITNDIKLVFFLQLPEKRAKLLQNFGLHFPSLRKKLDLWDFLILCVCVCVCVLLCICLIFYSMTQNKCGHYVSDCCPKPICLSVTWERE